MATQTKDISSTPQASSLQSSDNLIVTTGGGIKRLPMSALETAMAADLNNPLLQMALDGVFIVHHKRSDNFPYAVKPHKWAQIQASGEIAEGVMVVEGGRHIVVAPTESATGLAWSSAAVSGGGFATSDRLAAIADFDGRANTTAQIAHTECSSASYAPGYCNAYSRTNENSQGLNAGKWWLPSLGEMLMVFANLKKINYALSLISGAMQIKEDSYWTSTDSNSSGAWACILSTGFISSSPKVTGRYGVRPVSAFYR